MQRLSDSRLTLYDAEGNFVAEDDLHAGFAAHLEFSVDIAGIFYIGVTSTSGVSSGTYVLLSETQSMDDHGNGLDRATPLPIGVSTVGNLEHGQDTDMFLFQAQAGETVVFTTELSGLHDSVLTLYDAQGNFMFANDDYAGLGSRIEFTPSMSGTFYIGVSSYAGLHSGSYALLSDSNYDW